MAAIAASRLPLRRISVEEYHALAEQGILREDERVELLDGLIVAMSPRTPRHEAAIVLLRRWLTDQLDERQWVVRVAAPLVGEQSEPEPDLSVIAAEEFSSQRHPRQAALLIEVALSSRAYDLTVKPAIYAPVAQEYWVVDLAGEQLIAHRDPQGTRWRERERYRGKQQVRCGALPLGPLVPGAFFVELQRC